MTDAAAEGDTSASGQCRGKLHLSPRAEWGPSAGTGHDCIVFLCVTPTPHSVTPASHSTHSVTPQHPLGPQAVICPAGLFVSCPGCTASVSSHQGAVCFAVTVVSVEGTPDKVSFNNGAVFPRSMRMLSSLCTVCTSRSLRQTVSPAGMTFKTQRLRTLNGWKFYCCQRRNFPHLLIWSKLIRSSDWANSLAWLPSCDSAAKYVMDR